MRTEFAVGDRVEFKYPQHEPPRVGEVIDAEDGSVLVRGLYQSDTWFLRSYLVASSCEGGP